MELSSRFDSPAPGGENALTHGWRTVGVRGLVTGAGRIEMVHVLELDPELGRHVSASALEPASCAAIAPLLSLAPGAPEFTIDRPAPAGHLGMLMIDGLIALRVSFGQIGSAEFIGPGDVLRPWAMSDTVDIFHAQWEALVPTRLAVLDRDFATRVRPWPELTAALLDRYTERLASQLLQSALRQVRRVDDRVLLALWHFAARWGQVGPEGRIVQLPNITGEVLAQVVGARRQSVSTALSALTANGAIQRRPGGGWLVRDKPLQLEHPEGHRRLSDRASRAQHTSPQTRA